MMKIYLIFFRCRNVLIIAWKNSHLLLCDSVEYGDALPAAQHCESAPIRRKLNSARQYSAQRLRDWIFEAGMTIEVWNDN